MEKKPPVKRSKMSKSRKNYLIIIGILLLSVAWAISPFGPFDLFNNRKISLDNEVVQALDDDINNDFFKKNVVKPLQKTTLIIFKKEQKAAIWITDNDNQNHEMLVDSLQINTQNGTRLYDNEVVIPEGFYEIQSVNSEDLSFVINFPNTFDTQKQVADKRPKLTSIITFETKKGIKLSEHLMTEFLFLAKETGVENTNIIIVPNDFRNDNNIPYCMTCPHWIEELYGSLRLYLEPFSHSDSKDLR